MNTTVLSAINEQINSEFEAFYTYLAMAAFCDEQKFWQGVRTNPKRSTAEVRSKFRDIDRRLADIEVYYTSRNTRLADEIDSLR